MKKIAVFTDLSAVSRRAVDYAAKLAPHFSASMVLVHINSSGEAGHREAARKELNELCDELGSSGIKASCHIGEGSFFAQAQNELDILMPWLVVVATHGKVGLRQHLLGSNILRLVRTISYPTIVVQENTSLPSKIEKILFPPGSHHNFMDKVRHTAEIAMAFNSQIDIYNIIKGGEVRSDAFIANLEETREYFEKNGIRHNYITEDATFYSAGYSRQTIAFVKENEYDLISIMAESSGENTGISDADKENMLLNTLSVPVLCI